MIKKNYESAQRFKRGFRDRYSGYTLKDAYYKSAGKREMAEAVRDKDYVRAKRNASNLPDSWDDIFPSRYCATSWKDYSKARKQWQVTEW